MQNLLFVASPGFRGDEIEVATYKYFLSFVDDVCNLG